MALPRVCMLGRSFLSRGSPIRVASSAFRSPRVTVAIPERQFTSWFGKDAENKEAAEPQKPTESPQSTEIPQSSAPPQEISEEAQQSRNARSIAALNVPKRCSRADVEALFQENGLDVVNVELRMDRFTFYNNRTAFVELANEEQVQKATQLLNSNESLGAQIHVVPIRPDYVWGSPNSVALSHMVIVNEAGFDAALRPIIEGRRLVFKVKAPGWAGLDARMKDRTEANRKIMLQALEPFGVEAVSRIAVNRGEKTWEPRFLAWVDMKTKQGADQAKRDIHDTYIQGLKVWVESPTVSPWIAYQLGKMDKGRLTLLQEKGLAPPPEGINEALLAVPVEKRERSRKSNRKR